MSPKFSQTLSLSALPDFALASPLPKDVAVSFEFFPPKTEKMEQLLWASVDRLQVLSPQFFSVTYGAGGSTRERTHRTVARIVKETAVPAAAHLTCVSATRDEVDQVARQYWDTGVKHIVALRGDPPTGMATYQPHPGGYAYAADLVAGLRRVADFEVSVAAYPEGHPEASSPQADLDNLKRKIDAGASRAITQFFLDADCYFRFVERAQAAGIDVPIIPGILPVTNFANLLIMSQQCGISVPSWMAELFSGLDQDPGTRKLIAAMVAAEQCRVLHAGGVKAFHFFTLNRADLSYAICHILGVRGENVATESISHG